MPTKAIKLKPAFKTQEFKAQDYNDSMDPNVLRAPPLVFPFNRPVNPFQTGLQLGAIGAAAGVGVAGIQRAIRLKAGDTTPVSVYKPMVLGAVIGAALGGLGGYRTRKKLEENQPYPPPTSWSELGERLQDNASESVNKYAGLRHIVMTKRAQEGVNVGMELAKIPLSFIPGVGTALFGYDALKGFGSGVSNLFKGNWRSAASGLGSGIGNTALGLLSLFPGAGGFIRGAKGVAAVNRLTSGAKAIRGIGNIGRLGQLAKGSPEAIQAAQYGAGRLGGLWRRLSPAMQRVSPATLNRMETWGQKVQPIAAHKGKLGLLSMGTMTGLMTGESVPGAVTGGMQAEQLPMPMRRPGMPMRGAYNPVDQYGIAKPTLFSNQGMPKFELPGVPGEY